MANYNLVTRNLREEYMDEDGVAMSAGPTNVTGPQSGTDPISATAVSPKKKKKSLFFVKRNPPKM
jgi:hypothetical protein